MKTVASIDKEIAALKEQKKRVKLNCKCDEKVGNTQKTTFSCVAYFDTKCPCGKENRFYH